MGSVNLASATGFTGFTGVLDEPGSCEPGCGLTRTAIDGNRCAPPRRMMTNVHPLAIVALTAAPATRLGYVIGRAFRFDAAVQQVIDEQGRQT